MTNWWEEQRVVPLQPLVDLIGEPGWIETAQGPRRQGLIDFICSRLKAEKRQVYRILKEYGGLVTVDQAERWADKLGVHPIEIWGDWAVLTATPQLERRRHRKAAEMRARYHSDSKFRAAKLAYGRRYRAEVRAAQLARRERGCASSDCDSRFVAFRGDQRFCSPTCRNREKMRRYRTKDAA